MDLTVSSSERGILAEKCKKLEKLACDNSRHPLVHKSCVNSSIFFAQLIEFTRYSSHNFVCALKANHVSVAPFYIDFHCTLEEHQSWSQNREILLGKPSAHRSTPDVVVLFGRGAGDADPAFGFMGNIHIQGSGALLIPYGVTRPSMNPPTTVPHKMGKY